MITHSAVKAKVLGKRIPSNKVHVVPWTVAPRPCATPFAKRSGLAVITQFGHQPNPDAVYWLVRHVMPLVWRRDKLVWVRDKSLRCLIAGYGWTADSLPWRDERVDIVGPIDDLAEIFSRVRLTAARYASAPVSKAKFWKALPPESRAQ